MAHQKRTTKKTTKKVESTCRSKRNSRPCVEAPKEVNVQVLSNQQ